MRIKVFSTIFTAILLTTVAVYQIDAGLSPVDDEDRFSITGSASIFQDAPTGNILKKYRQEGGQWVRFKTVKAKWFCRVTFSATVYGKGNADVLATGNAVHRADGSHFKTLWGDVNSERVSSWWLFNARETITAKAQKTIETSKESDVGSYKVTGTGYYKQAIGGDGLSVSYKAGGSVNVGGIDSGTITVPLEDDIPTFDIDIQCDPAAACANDNSDTDSSSSNPVVSPTPTSTDGTPNCPDCTTHCSSPCSCTNSGTCNGTVTDNTPNCQDCTSHCSSPCSCTNSGTCNGTVSYHACGEHLTTVSGDHSLQASCSSTDSNGNSCTVTSFYACDNHSHTYPAPTGPKCAAGHPYKPHNTFSVNVHRVRVCRFSGCSNTWQVCLTGWTSPLCNNPYRKSKGWHCGAQ